MIYALVKRDTGELKYHFFDRSVAMDSIDKLKNKSKEKVFEYTFICFPLEDGVNGQPIDIEFNAKREPGRLDLGV